MTNEYSVEYGRVGHCVLFNNVNLLTVRSLEIYLLTLKLLCPCSLYVRLEWRLNAISLPSASLRYELRVSKSLNVVINLSKAISWKFRL